MNNNTAQSGVVLCPSADFTVHANFCLFALHEQQCQRCGQAACCRWASVRRSPEFYVDKTSEANQLGIRDQISGWRRTYNSTWAAFDHSFLTNSIYEHSARHRALAGAANDQQQQQQFGIVQHRLHHACCLSSLSHNSTRSSAGADATYIIMATIMSGNVHHAEGNGAHVKDGTKLAKPLDTVVAAQTDACNNVKQYVLEAIRDKQELYNMEQYAIDYAHSIGLVAPMPDQPEGTFSNILAVPPPINLLPSPFPRELYEHAVDVQRQLSELYFRIASDHEFLMDAFKDVIKSDPFMARLVQIAKLVHAEGVNQPLAVQLQRSDYMAHLEPSDGTLALKQVEVNIGPLGGPGFATGASKLHHKMLDKVAIVRGGRLATLANAYAPVDRSRQKLAYSLYQSWKLFGDPKAILLFLGTPDMMYFEQRQFFQFEVEKLGKQDGHLVKVLALTFVEAAKRMSLDETGDFSLYMDGTKRVALVQITDGNMPDEFPTEREWAARTMMERSTAILSPNIRFQLSCTKKIQQLLAKPGTLELFIPNNSKLVAELRSTFTGLWGLEEDDQVTKEVIEDAIRSPHNYVLKAQLESGLGNFFDEQVAEMLQKLSKQDRAAYILQQRINPLVVKNFMMRQMKSAQMEDVVSELGIYASLIGNQSTGQILHNSVDGHTIRSKPSKLNQGGVGCGGGTVDSALLFPAAEMLEANLI